MTLAKYQARSVHFVSTFQRLTASTANAVNVVGMAALVVLMLIMAVDTVMRCFFNVPMGCAWEVVEFALVTLVFAGMAYTALKKGHVRVDILYRRLQPKTRAVLDSITSLLIVILLGFMVWQTVLCAGRSWAGGEETAALFVPIAPFMLVTALGCAVWLLVVLSDLFSSTTQVLEGKHHGARLGLLAGGLLTLLLCAALVCHWLPWEISPVTAGIIALAVLIPVLLSGMPVGFVLVLLGFLGMSVLTRFNTGVIPLGQVPFTEGHTYGMAVVPLFILMGELVYVSRLGQDVYAAAHRWLGQLPGGLASATVGACAGFASVCGSTVATAVTMSTVALPEMRRYKYEPSLAAGCIAAGGNIGTMIPPSITFIIYGIITEQSIGRLFIAGIFPGILMAILFILTITIRCRLNPKLGPSAPGVSIKEKLVALKGVWSMLLLFLLVMGGIYAGVFTPTEAGGIGAFGALIISLSLRRLTRQGFIESLRSTMVITCMAFLLFIGATIFSNLIALSRLPFIMATFIAEAGLSSLAVILLILFVFLVLGCVMPSWPVMILVVPIVFPVILSVGFDPIWFGVMVVLMCEMGAITPPVGINVFAVAGVAKNIPMSTIFRGVFPFILALAILAGLLIAFPQIALFLPTLIKG